MRRRRQKNPLLGRILLISIVVHIILLPILAYFGAFKKIQQHFVEAQVVVLPPPVAEKQKPIVKKEERKVPKTKTAQNSKGKTSPSHTVAHSNLPQPKIALADPGKGGDNGAGSAEQGNGAAGVLPTDPGTKKTETTKGDPNAGNPVETVKPVVPEVKQPVKPIVQNPVTIPDKPVKPVDPIVAPRVPVFVAAQPVSESQPKPTIPDDLRSEALDKTFIAEFTVGEDGTPMQVKAVQSTGNDELDRRALDAAKKWRFKPATRDGQPVVGTVRLFIEFQVS